jgi:hypothetical protein
MDPRLFGVVKSAADTGAVITNVENNSTTAMYLLSMDPRSLDFVFIA